MTPPFEVLARGYRFCEAPRLLPDGAVGFSDLLGGGYHRVDAGGSVATLLADRLWIGGATVDRGDAMLVGGQGGLAVVTDGTARPVLETIDDRPIVAVNDIEADPSGGVYGGTIDFGAVFGRGEPPAGGHFFHLSPQGSLTILRDDVTASNGIGFSPDGGTLYHSESTVGIWAWDVRKGRAAGTPTLFAAADDCDGLAVDAEGGVWIAFWREAVLRRYRPDAVIDREIALPFPNLVSLAFGGPDMTDLYITTGASETRPDCGGLIRIRTDVPGLPVHRSAFAKEG